MTISELNKWAPRRATAARVASIQTVASIAALSLLGLGGLAARFLLCAPQWFAN